MNSKRALDSKQWLKAIFSNSLKLEIEFARLSILNFQTSHLAGMVLVFLEYAQLISQCILSNPFFLNDPTFSDDIFVRVAVFIAKLFNPGHFLHQDKIGPLTITVFTALILLALSKIFLLCYVLYIAKTKLRGQPILIKLWQWIFHFQSKVIYFFISSFWINAIFLIKADGSFDVFRIGKKGMLALSIILVVIEFVFSAVLQIRYFYALPVAKNLFSAKSNNCGIINLFQKLSIQIIHVALPVNTLPTDWIMSVVGLCLSLLRSAEFYLKLPLYQIKALIFEGKLVAAVLSMNLVCITQAIMKSLDSKENNTQFMLAAWIILSILAFKASSEFLKKFILNLLINNTKPELFIHKICFIKELQKFHNKPNKHTPKYDWYYLLHMMVTVNIQRISVWNNENNENLDINSKTDLNKLILNYLQYLSDTFPRDKFIKLYLAYFYGIKLKSFGNCIRCIKESNLDHSRSKNGLTASLLILKIQDIIQASVKQQNDKINLNIYLEGLTLFDRLEERILVQTALQIKLYQEILSETPDLANIFNYSQKIKSTRQRIEETMDLIDREIPEANLNPLLLYADYQLKINHSTKEYRNYQKIYEKRHQKYTKHFEREELNKYNAYQQTTALVIVGTQKQDNGKIIYGSKALESIYGGTLHIGANVSTYLPPSLRNFVADARSTVSNSNDRSRLQTNIRTYGYHQEGYLIPITVYTDLFPVMTEGLFLMMMIRPVPLTQDYLLVRENGDIESPTENIAKKLGLPSPTSTLTNLKTLSEELAQVNEAFNFIASLEKQRARGIDQCIIPRKKQIMSKIILDETEARELVRVYTEEGRSVELTSMKDDTRQLMYYCNFKSLSFGPTTLRLISLKEVSSENSQGSDTHFESEELKEEEGDFGFEDEKQAGWIPLETISPLKINQRNSVFSVRDTLGPTAVGETFQTMEDHLLTPRSNHGFLLKESVMPTPMTPRSNPEKNFLKAPTGPKMILTSTRDRNFEENKRIRVGEQRVLSIASSQQSRLSNKQKTEEAFQAALTIKYYPKSWFCLFLMFYFAAIAIFTIQLSSKIFVESAFRNFELKKDILVDAGSRNSLLLQSQVVIRIALDFGSGFIDINAIGRLAEAAAGLNTSTALYIQELETANNNILRKLNGLEKSLKSRLFNKNVRVYELEQLINDEGAFIETDSFEATNAVVQIALSFFAFMKEGDIEGAFSAFLTLTRNSLNDLLIETENISAVFFASIDDQSDNIIHLLTVFLIIILGWIFCVLLSFIFIIRKLYREEKTNMLAVTKLNKSVLKRICSDMAAFETKLKGKNELFMKEESLLVNSEKPSTLKETSKNHQQQQSSSVIKKPNSNGIRRKYTIYFLMLSPFIILSVVLLAVNSASIGHFVQELRDLKALFSFVGEIKDSASIGYIAVMELFFSNNTSFIKNQTPLVQIQNQVEAIQSVRAGGLVDFSLGNKIPTFEHLMFGDPCVTIKNSAVDLYCSILADYGKSSGIVNLMNILEDMLTDKENRYIASNKSMEALGEIQLDELDLFTSAFQVLSFECDMFSSDITVKFEQALESSQKNRNLIFELFAAVLVAEGVFFWKTVLSKLKEASNQFKNVLQTFPSNLVLSNFLLKIFLVNTSKGFLDLSIKSDL